MLQLVRNSALFALGQFAEHLQPDISKYHAELLPVLFDYLTQVGGILMDLYFCCEVFGENRKNVRMLTITCGILNVIFADLCGCGQWRE